jgi:hypothetical protein
MRFRRCELPFPVHGIAQKAFVSRSAKLAPLPFTAPWAVHCALSVRNSADTPHGTWAARRPQLLKNLYSVAHGSLFLSLNRTLLVQRSIG